MALVVHIVSLNCIIYKSIKLYYCEIMQVYAHPSSRIDGHYVPMAMHEHHFHQLFDMSSRCW